MAAHEFGQRVHDNVGAVIDRSQKDRRRYRVVDNERNTVSGSDCRERLDVANVSRRIANAFTEDRARFLVDELFDCVGLIGFCKADIYALARQNVREQRVRGAVELRDGYDVEAHPGEVEHGVVQCRLPRTHAQSPEAALKRGDAAFKYGGRRIADAAVAVAFDL